MIRFAAAQAGMSLQFANAVRHCFYSCINEFGYTSLFSAIFIKGNNSDDFLFASLDDFSKMESTPKGNNFKFFPLRVDPILKRGRR